MKAEVLAVDGLLSWARGNGEQVEVRVSLAGADLSDGPAEVILRAQRRRVAVQGLVETADDATYLRFSVPRAPLGWAAWQLTVQPTGGPSPVRVEARLLAPADQPVALLPGPVPSTKMRPPKPKPRRRRAQRGAPLSRRNVVRRLPSAVLTALGKARRAARRVTAGR